MLVAIAALVHVSKAQECSCTANSPKFFETCTDVTTRKDIPSCVGDGKCHHGPADSPICQEEASEFYKYVGLEKDQACIDFKTLKMFSDP